MCNTLTAIDLACIIHGTVAFYTDKQAEYSLRDVRMAAGLAAGLTIKEIAEACGVTEKAIYQYNANHGERVQGLREDLSKLLKVNVREAKEIAIEQARAEFESRLGKFMTALDRAVDSDDPKTALDAAKEGFNRIFGKATSNVNVSASGRIEHAHLHQLSEAAAKAFSLDAESDIDLHSRARLLTQGDRPVIDVSQ